MYISVNTPQRSRPLTGCPQVENECLTWHIFFLQKSTSNNTEITLWQTDRPRCMRSCMWIKTCRYINHNYDYGQCILGLEQCETLVVMYGTINALGPPRCNCLSWGRKNELGRYPVNEPVLVGRAWIWDALVVGKVDPRPPQVGTFWGVSERRKVDRLGSEVKILTRISNFFPHFIKDVITFPCWD